MKWILLVLPLALVAQTIEEKRGQLLDANFHLTERAKRQMEEVNEELATLRAELKELHSTVDVEDEEACQEVLGRVQEIRSEIRWIEEAWRETAVAMGESELYALWHEPWTSLEQLVIDYGSPDYVYVIPPEVGGMRLSISSNIPVPRESWDEMLSLVLAQNGVGICKVNPYVKQLYIVAQQPALIEHVTDRIEDLDLVDPQERVCFILHSQREAPRVTRFLDRFINPLDTTLHLFGDDLFILSSAQSIRELLKLYRFVDASVDDRGYQLVSLKKFKNDEIVQILDIHFDTNKEEQGNALLALAPASMPRVLFLSGPSEVVKEAEEMVAELESQAADPQEVTLYTYTAKHSDAEELAKALGEVYGLMKGEAISSEIVIEEGVESEGLAIDPAPVTTSRPTNLNGAPQRAGNFVVFPKTGTIIMVVEQALLNPLKELLGKLDLPKKMVRIDVLFFEKKIEGNQRFGMDLLKLGSSASNRERAGLSWDCRDRAPGRGIMQFFLSGMKSSSAPAYDLAYNFLMGQEDIRINSNPSVTTVNHTPAVVELVEEISIDDGTYLVDPNGNDSILKQQFSRRQFGITMTITPNINANLDAEYITLQTDVLFDTPKASRNSRPDVIRRHITNEVRVKDGETVILGGLRSKLGEDSTEGLPFIGEIPGIGKLFSCTKMHDVDTEMFIFITPHVVDDPVEELRRVKHELLCKRQGDIPELLEKLEEAREAEKSLIFGRTMKAIFGTR